MEADREFDEAIAEAGRECETLVSEKIAEAENLSEDIFGRLKAWQ